MNVLYGNEFETETDPIATIAESFAGEYDGWGRDDEGSNLTEEKIAAELRESQIVCAFYEYEDYAGDAFVLFVKDGTPYEVNASHCSCYGLHGQWVPEETTWQALAMRQWEREPYGDAVKAAIAQHQE